MKKLYKNLDFCSRDMLNFNFPEKGQGLVSPPYFVHDFSRKLFHVLLTDQIPTSECLYFLRYWAIRVSKLFVIQVVTS